MADLRLNNPNSLRKFRSQHQQTSQGFSSYIIIYIILVALKKQIVHETSKGSALTISTEVTKGLFVAEKERKHINSLS